MDRKTKLGSLVVMFGWLLSTSVSYAATDASAPVVKLRTSCMEAGATLSNCFTTLASLTDWIWNTRKPSVSAPLLVDIGPGTFNGSFQCANSGYVTLRGSGPQQTHIVVGLRGLGSNACTQLGFENLTIRGDQNSMNFTWVDWQGGGISRWSNVDLITYGYGWIEGSCGATPGQHYWFGSRIVAYSRGGSLRNYLSACDVSWFIGSEITSIANSATSYVNTLVAANSGSGHGEIHVYGSVVRATAAAGVVTSPPTPADATNSFAPIVALSGGEIHIHGSAIDVLSDAANQLTVVAAQAGGMVHANAASYNVKTGIGGSVMRIFNSGGHVHAPYAWEGHPEAPFAGSGVAFTSQDGADTAVVTNTTDGYPHPVIYTSKCTSRWFDTITRSCR